MLLLVQVVSRDYQAPEYRYVWYGRIVYNTLVGFPANSSLDVQAATTISRAYRIYRYSQLIYSHVILGPLADKSLGVQVICGHMRAPPSLPSPSSI